MGLVSLGGAHLLIVREITLLIARSHREVILFTAGILGNNPVVVQPVEGDLAVDVGHVPMDPGPAHFIVEAVDGRVPCAAPEPVAGLEEKCLLACQPELSVICGSLDTETLPQSVP